MLSEFLWDLFKHRRVLVSVPDTSTDADFAGATVVLNRAEETWRQSLPSYRNDGSSTNEFPVCRKDGAVDVFGYNT